MTARRALVGAYLAAVLLLAVSVPLVYAVAVALAWGVSLAALLA
jgi:hypothetical protein